MLSKRRAELRRRSKKNACKFEVSVHTLEPIKNREATVLRRQEMLAESKKTLPKNMIVPLPDPTVNNAPQLSLQTSLQEVAS